MIRVVSALLWLVFAPAASVGATTGALHTTSGFSCSKSDGKVVIKFGVTKRPSFFGIRTPDNQFVFVRYPPRDVDVLGKNYESDPVNLNIHNLRGVTFRDDQAQKVPVFTLPGEYVLQFEDAVRAEYEDQFRLRCSVVIDPAEVTKHSGKSSTRDSIQADTR